MSYKLSGSDRRILMIAAVVFAALIFVAVLIIPSAENEDTAPTTYSSGSSGAKAAFLLLRETGYRVERWEKSLTQIKEGNNITLILAEPSTPVSKNECAALHGFIRKGGRVIAIGQSAGLLLPESSSVADPVQGFVWEKFPAVTPTLITRAAPEITMAPKAQWRPGASATALYANATGEVVVDYPYGDGRVIWWASATPLTNAGITQPGNLAFLLACLGEKEKTSILWDEYLHGYGLSKKPTKDAIMVEFALLQLLVLGLAVVWTFSRRSGPLRPSATEIRLSPIEFAETLGGLYEHAGASSVAVDVCYQRFNYWLSKQLGIPAAASAEEFERAVRDRWNFEDESFASTLRECASARYSPSLPPRKALQLIRALHSYASRLKLFPAPTKEDN